MSDDAKAASTTTTEVVRGGWLSRPLIAGIVSGAIVLIFVQPFLAFLWRFVLSNISSVSDKACRAAALDYTDAYWFMSETRLSAFIIGLASGIMVFSYARAARKERVEGFRRSIEHRFITSRLATTLWFIFVLLVYTYSGAERYLAMQLKASFHQRLAVLAPRISEQEYKELLASWANMQTQGDYRRIVTTMEVSAQRAGVSLPKFLPGAAP